MCIQNKKLNYIRAHPTLFFQPLREFEYRCMAFCQCTKGPTETCAGWDYGRASLRGKHEEIALICQELIQHYFSNHCVSLSTGAWRFANAQKNPHFSTTHVFLASSLSRQKSEPYLRRDPAVVEFCCSTQNRKKVVSQRKNEQPLFVRKIYHHTSR